MRVTGFAIFIIGGLIVSASGQEYMRSTWYSTMREVKSNEGYLVKETEKSMSFTSTFLGKPAQKCFYFKDRMLNCLLILSTEIEWNEVMDSNIEMHGKPIYKGEYKNHPIYYWKTPNEIIVLNASPLSLIIHNSKVSILYFPSDLDELFIPEKVRNYSPGN